MPSRPVSRRKQPIQERSRTTVESIVEAAARVFEKRGYAGTTNEIAEVAGVSVGTLYQYFPNKDALLLALAERHLTEGEAVLDEAIRRLAHERLDIRGMVTVLVAAVVQVHKASPGVQQVLLDMGPRTPALLQRVEVLKERILTAVMQHLEHLGTPAAQAYQPAIVTTCAIGALVHELVVPHQNAARAQQAAGAEPMCSWSSELIEMCTAYLERAVGARQVPCP